MVGLTSNIILMKTTFVKRKLTSGWTFFDFVYGLCLAILLYGSYLYVPLIYKQQELQGLVKDYTFRSAGASPVMIRQAVIEDAKRKLGITLNEDDVIVNKDEDRTRIDVIWRAVIQLPFNYKIQRNMRVEYDRKFL